MTATNQHHGVLAVIPDGLFTRAQVAEMVGRSYDTIRRWHYEGRCTPSHSQDMGGVTVWLYDTNDVRDLVDTVNTMKMGRPPKDDDDQQAQLGGS
jgi:hypothetical protein